MTGYSEFLSGDFVRATTPTGEKIIIPFWTADQARAKNQIEQHGIKFDAPSGIAHEGSTRPTHVRVVMDAGHFRDDVRRLEKPGIADFISAPRKVQLIPDDPKTAKIAIMQAHILPAELETVASDPRVLAMRPYGDPHFPEFVKGWQEKFAAPTPAPSAP